MKNSSEKKFTKLKLGQIFSSILDEFLVKQLYTKTVTLISLQVIQLVFFH